MKQKQLIKWLYGLLLTILMWSFGMESARAQSYASLLDDVQVTNATITKDKPYILMKIPVYQRYVHSSGIVMDLFFQHDQYRSGSDGPAIYVNDTYVCSPDWELAWPGEGYGNYSGIEDARGNDTWWGSVYQSSNKRYTVAFYNPHRKQPTVDTYSSVQIYYVYMYVFDLFAEVGSQPSVKIGGSVAQVTSLGGIMNRVKKSGVCTKTITNTKVADPVGGGSTTPNGTFTRPSDGVIQYSGTWNSNSGYSSELVFANPSNSNRYIKQAFSSGVASTNSYTKFSLSDIDMGNSSRYNPVKINMHIWQNGTYTYDGNSFAVGFIKRFNNINVPGYYKAENLETAINQWKKQCNLNWTVDETKYSTGTWNIYRYPKGNPSSKTLIAENIKASNRSYNNISLPDYDTDYTLELTFVPTGTPAGTTYSELTSTIDVRITRKFEFASVNVEEDESSILLTWENEELQGNENYVFHVFRREWAEDEWTEIGSINVGDKTKTSYKYLDKANLSTCKVYLYKIQITMLEGQLFDSSIMENGNPINDDDMPQGSLSGMSHVTSLTSSKGEYTGFVKLAWTAKQIGKDGTKFELFRRILGTDGSWSSIYKVTGTEESYYYEDNTALPGQYYEYKVQSTTACGDTYTYTLKTNDGFCRATGIISGRVTYGTGTAVKDVKVILQKNDEEESQGNQFYSMRVNGTGAGVRLEMEEGDFNEKFKTSDFTIQMFVRPDNLQEATNPTFMQLGTGDMKLGLGEYVEGKGFKLTLGGNELDGLYVLDNKYSSITMTKTGDEYTVYVFTTDKDGVTYSSKSSTIAGAVVGSEESKYGLCVGGSWVSDSEQKYLGYIDEVRVFSGKVLGLEDIKRNWNRTLSGTENGLMVYWPMDEGITNQATAYDYSKTNGVANSNHGIVAPGTSVSTTTPYEEQLSLYGLTDAQGNYTIRGVPFSGSGTTYTVTPIYGEHEFSPQYLTRFVSANSLNHSGVDYTDNSSFKVTGKVCYANTTFPVDSVYLYVDGNICSKDGQLIVTNSEGEFEISVPIGDHFISLKKDGHTFSNGGCFPNNASTTGEKYTFEKPELNLQFFDETLVNFTGRIVGGKEEGEKKLGFGLSKNNIGQVMIELQPTNLTHSLNVDRSSGDAVIGSTILPCASATKLINSESYRGAKVNGIDKSNSIYIKTDPQTGEFSAKVPPLNYIVNDWYAVKDPTKEKIDLGNGVPVNLTNPLSIYTDTATYVNSAREYVKGSYDYCEKLVQTYTATPKLVVTQEGATEGMFGEKTYTYQPKQGVPETFALYDENGYKFGKQGESTKRPIFITGNKYIFNIECFEEYVNLDDNSVSRLYMGGDSIKISNQLSIEQDIVLETGNTVNVKDNTVVLDSLGRAKYQWKAGFPCISGDYTRTIHMYADRAEWGADFKGIILGQLTTGNDFLTSGPDLVTMVLRDPPGSNSSATWEKGTVYSTMQSNGGTWTSDNKVTNNISLGCYLEVYNGIGVAVAAKYDGTIEETNTIEVTVEGEACDVWNYSSTVKKAVSTSSDPEFVGANADIFIGTSTNFLVGDANEVGIFRDDVNGTYYLDKQKSTSISTQFETDFAYTAQYIESVLIPGWEDLKRQKLETKTQAQIDNLLNTENKTDDNFYYTTLAKTDPKFGQEGTYKVHYTKKERIADKIEWMNLQIENWKVALAKNESEKVSAHEDKGKQLEKNLSFDAGTTITKSVEISETYNGWSCDVKTGVTFGIEGAAGFKFNENGWRGTISNSTGGGYHHSSSASSDSITVFSYTLADGDATDALTVDVYKSEHWGPIFRTIAGRTCNPYEGEVKTKYLNEEYTIMMATKQVEVPKISISPEIIKNVPAGTAANFTLSLGNESEIGADIYYKLLVVDENNPNGAQFSIDGQTLTENRLVKVAGGDRLTKALQIKQTDLSRMDYDSLAIVFASQGQYDPTSNFPQIADTAYVSVHFIPSASPVKIDVDKNMVTTNNLLEGKPKLTVTLSEFNYNFYGQDNYVIQYKREDALKWIDSYGFLMKEPAAGLKPAYSYEIIPADKAKLQHVFDLSEFSDGTYIFRIASNGNNTTVYSDEMKIIKDVATPKLIGRPQPADGILHAGDDIIVTFNEDIAPDLIDKEIAFKVKGVLNEYEVKHDVALKATNQVKAAATTEADINLSKKDFAVGMWVYATSAGNLFTHGKAENKFNIGIDNNKKLAVSVPGGSVVSTNEFPLNKWVYLAFNYTYDEGTVNAQVSYGSENKSLLTRAEVGSYEGNGPVAVLSGINANMHELTLWDKALRIDDLNTTMNRTKKPSESNLIGYWKFDEGHGIASEDKARSRNMVLGASNEWFMNTTNYAAKLSGTNHIDVSIADCPVAAFEDYALEFWFLGSEDNADKTIFDANGLTLNVTTDKSLQLTSGDYTMPLGSGKYCDGTWHHFALNVLRNGMATAYVDGESVGQANADYIKPLDGDALVLGAKRTGEIQSLFVYSNYFKGAIDDVRLWKASMTGKLISDNRYQSLAGDETGLALYKSFEDEETKVGGPELKPVRSLSNVSYTYVASDRQIAFTLTDDPQILEGCTIEFSVGSIKDLHGNGCEDIKWSVLVKQNQLEWAENSVEVKQMNGEEAAVSATIVNRGASTEQWSISGLPSWITANITSGTLPALSEQKITFTISEVAQIGKYEETVFLSGNNDIKVPFTINIEVTGDEPLWTVNPAGFSSNMTIFGQLKHLGKISENTSDMVAAFIDGECRGVAKPIYYPRYDTYFTLMTIYGNDDMDKDITFKAWNASEGKIYPVVACYENSNADATTIYYQDNDTYGSYNQPFIWDTEDKIEENLALVKGWNWASLYVDNGSNNSVNTMLATIKDSGKTVKGINAFSTNTGSTWGGTLTALEVGKMYMVNMNSADTLTMQGVEVDPTLSKYTISLNKGWNWIGYSASYNMGVDNAFAGTATDGDQVKSQTAFAMYDGYEWVGTLRNIVPGQGYMYQKNSSENLTYNYPSKASVTVRSYAKAHEIEMADYESIFDFDGSSYYKYQNNMTMVARVVDGEIPLEGVEVAIVANGEIRDVQVSDSEGRVFFTIPGNNEDILRFHIADGNMINVADMTVEFESNVTYGTLKAPCLIQMGEATGIGVLANDSEATNAYSVAGYGVNRDIYRGITISKGKKTYMRR